MLVEWPICGNTDHSMQSVQLTWRVKVWEKNLTNPKFKGRLSDVTCAHTLAQYPLHILHNLKRFEIKVRDEGFLGGKDGTSLSKFH